MVRMLRIEGLVDRSETDPDKLDLSEYQLEDLETLRDIVNKEIEKRLKTSGGEIEIEWEGYWDGDLTSKKPYLAIMKPHEERRFDYDFLKMARTQDKNGQWRFTYYGFLPIGTILKGRVTMGDEHYYKVVPSGLKIIGEVEVLRAITKMKKEMKKDEKTAEKPSPGDTPKEESKKDNSWWEKLKEKGSRHP